MKMYKTYTDDKNGREYYKMSYNGKTVKLWADGQKIATDYGGVYYDADRGYAVMDLEGHQVNFHTVVWEKANGVNRVPKGKTLHHADHNKFNNNVENVELWDKTEHYLHHLAEDLYELGEPTEYVNVVRNRGGLQFIDLENGVSLFGWTIGALKRAMAKKGYTLKRM